MSANHRTIVSAANKRVRALVAEFEPFVVQRLLEHVTAIPGLTPEQRRDRIDLMTGDDLLKLLREMR